MDFQKLLLGVGEALGKEEVKALAFLCADLLGRNPALVDSASVLFSRLMDQDHLSPDQPHLLTELLSSINRFSLARELRFDHQASGRSLISPYRKLLYSLSEDLTDDELRNMKFLLNNKLPRRKLDENVTTLEVFLEMEHKDLISDTHLDFLKMIIRRVCPVLEKKINQHIAQHVSNTGPVRQETARPRAKTYSFEQNEVLLHQEGTGEKPDRPNMSQGVDECKALTHELSGLSTETSTSASFKVKTDALVTSPQETETSSGIQTSLTTSPNSDLGSYTMTARKRRTCLIINNIDFSDKTKREGTMVDEETLCKVFSWLHFNIEVHRDCKSEKMLSVMQELGRRNHSEADCLVCFVLSHGLEGGVFGVDGGAVDIRRLMEPFNGLNCASLKEKPKLFFIQACQGMKEQRAAYIDTDSPTHAAVQSDAVGVKDSIPADADFLLGMATVPDFVSFREKGKGTWFIQSLCQNLVQMVPRGDDLVSILTKVNADVSKKTDCYGVRKQMPQPAFSLTKKVIFPVPSCPPPVL